MENHKIYINTNKPSIKIKFSISYLKPNEAYSWATGEKRKTGYRVNAVPVEVTLGNGYKTESFTAFTGFGDTLLECNRRSNKKYEQAIKTLEERMIKYLSWFELRGFIIDNNDKNELIEQQKHKNNKNQLILSGI